MEEEVVVVVVACIGRQSQGQPAIDKQRERGITGVIVVVDVGRKRENTLFLLASSAFADANADAGVRQEPQAAGPRSESSLSPAVASRLPVEARSGGEENMLKHTFGRAIGLRDLDHQPPS